MSLFSFLGLTRKRKFRRRASYGRRSSRRYFSYGRRSFRRRASYGNNFYYSPRRFRRY